MRLIDADALKETFEIAHKEARHDREYANAFFSDGGEVSTEWWCVEDMVDNAPTIEPQKWIPCAEMLPDKKQDVFVTLNYLKYEAKTDIWDGDLFFYYGEKVVAWMPFQFPEPYKEEEE